MNTTERKEPSFNNSGEISGPITSYRLSSNPRPPRSRIKKHPALNYWLNLIFFMIIGISLLGTDFVLYSSSGAGNIFSAFPMPRPDILVAMVIIASITGVIYFLLSGFTFTLSLLTAGIIYLFSTAMFSQFSDYGTLPVFLGLSSTYISLAACIISFILLLWGKKKIRFLFACIAAGVFCYVSMQQNSSQPEYTITKNETPATENADKNVAFINIMLPELPSYSYLSGLSDDQANKVYRDQLRSIMLGFHAQYGFKLFPNAYVNDYNPYLNAADNLNFAIPADKYANIQSQIQKDSHWTFKMRNDYEVNLANAEMIDALKSQGYKINAYQSHGINLCRKNNENNVDYCLTQISNPNTINNNQYSMFEKAGIILTQWLESTGWFEKSAPMIYNRLSKFFSVDKLPLIGTSYDGLYVINSIQTFDLAMQDILNNKGKQAYFIYVDLPAETFVYDDMCNLKPVDDWIVKAGQPWTKKVFSMEKRSAQFRQTMCLYGKLSQLMQNLQTAGLLADSTIVIQGLSGMNDLSGMPDISQADAFLNGRTTNVAISAPDSRKFTINKSICSTPDIINQTMNDQKCVEFNGEKPSKSTKDSILAKMEAIVYDNDTAQKSYQQYVEWFKAWKQNNYPNTTTQPVEPDLQPIEDADSTEGEPKPLNEGNDDEIIHKEPKMLPLEEKSIGESKVMSGQINVAPEAKVESLSEMSREPVEEVSGENL